MPRLIEWDSLDVRIDGAKLSEMARAMTAAEPMLERLALTFTNGLLRVDGSVRKFISIPFTVEINQILPKGTTVRVLLVSLIRNHLPKELVGFEPPATFVVSLERFLPPFVSADIQKIWIIDGGLAVTLGRGGADLPPSVTAESRQAGLD